MPWDVCSWRKHSAETGLSFMASALVAGPLFLVSCMELQTLIWKQNRPVRPFLSEQGFASLSRTCVTCYQPTSAAPQNTWSKSTNIFVWDFGTSEFPPPPLLLFLHQRHWCGRVIIPKQLVNSMFFKKGKLQWSKVMNIFLGHMLLSHKEGMAAA